MRIAKSILLALFFSYLLGACGLKGPLYLPKDEPVATPDKAQSTKPAGQKQEPAQKPGQPSAEKEDDDGC